MIKGLQYILLVSSAISISLLGGKNIGLTKEIDNRRECVICEVETPAKDTEENAEQETKLTMQYADNFWVTGDETVYLLDTYGNCVLEVSKEESRMIPLSGTVLPGDITVCGEKLFIYDDALSELQIYTVQGELLARSKVALAEDYVKQLNCLDGEVLLFTYGSKWYTVNQENGSLVLCAEKQVPQFSVGDYNYAEYIETDEDGTVYTVHTKLVENCSIIAGELTLRAASADGAILGSYIFPVQEYEFLPDRYVQVHQNGNIYVMVPTETFVEVRKIALKDTVESKLAEISEQVMELEAKYAEKGTTSAAIQYSREEVYARALEMIEYTWTLKPKNTLYWYWDKHVKLPREIEAIRQENKEKSSWSVSMTGIPYCWGGHHCLEWGNAGYTFQGALNAGFIAGNIDTSDYYQYKSAGVDCSGFVGDALGFKVKKSTSGLAKIGSKRNDIKTMELVDILVSPGDHVIFFCDWIDDATLLLAEATLREGKTVLHARSLNEFVVYAKYQMRSPW